MVLVGRIGQAAPDSPGVALRLLERRHPQRWGRARADLIQPPDEFPAETPEPGPQRPPTLQERVVALPPEWQVPIIKLFDRGGPREDRRRVLRRARPAGEPARQRSATGSLVENVGRAIHPDTFPVRRPLPTTPQPGLLPPRTSRMDREATISVGEPDLGRDPPGWRAARNAT